MKHLTLDQLQKGEQLYHYTKCYAVQNIFRTNVLFATKSSFLNDTNEMGYILHVAQEVIREIQNPDWQRLLLNQIIDTMEDFKRHDIFVVSFSEEEDSITLWSEFGNQTGYNIAFDGIGLLERISDRQKIYCHGRVLYDHGQQLSLIRSLFFKITPDRIGLPFQEILQRETVSQNTPEFMEYCHKLQRSLNIYAMFFKQQQFSAEREYRVVFKNPDRSRIRFREKDGFLLPYIEVDISGIKNFR